MRTLKNKTKRFNDMRRRRGHGNITRRKEKTRAKKTRARKTRRRGTRRKETRKKGTRRKGMRRKGMRRKGKTRARGNCPSCHEPTEEITNIPKLSTIQEILRQQEETIKNNDKENAKLRKILITLNRKNKSRNTSN